MAVMSAGRPGDQVTLTSVLHEFPESICVKFDFLLQESKPGTRGIVSVYLLSKQRVPVRQDIDEWRTVLNGGWKRASVCIPSGSYHVMFLATLGLPYHSDIYLDNIELTRSCSCSRNNIIKPTGNFYFLVNQCWDNYCEKVVVNYSY